MKLPFAPHLHGRDKAQDSRLSPLKLNLLESGGEGEIRTHGTRKGSTVFETAAFDHSATSPSCSYQDNRLKGATT